MAPFPACGQEGGRGRRIPHKVAHFIRVLAVKRVKYGSELLDVFTFYLSLPSLSRLYQREVSGPVEKVKRINK